jgi:hypothetical protein
MAAKKHDPFFIHLWDELTTASILQGEGLRNWMDVPGQIQAKFIDAAQRAMQLALGAPPKARPRKKAAKKKTAKKVPKAKKAPKSKAKAKTKPKAAKH